MLRILVAALVLVAVTIALLLVWGAPSPAPAPADTPGVERAAPRPAGGEPTTGIESAPAATAEPAPAALPFVAGTVVDSDDRPIAGASVSARLRNAAPGPPPVTSTDTADEEGRFRVEVAREGIVVVLAEAAGFCRFGVWALVGSEDVVVRLEHCGGARGVVLDPAGLPIEGARVEAVVLPPGSNADAVQRTTRSPGAVSSPSGQFSVEGMKGGSYALIGMHALHAPSRVAVRVPATGHVDGIRITLGDGQTIGGRVRDDDGQPVTGARVAARAASNPESQWFLDPELADQTTTTDDDGTFVLGGLLVEDYILAAEHPRYHGASARDRSSLRTPAGSEGVEIVLTRGMTLRGRTETDTGETLVGVDVSGGARSSFSRTVSDSDGEFTLQGLPAGTIQLMGTLDLHRRAHIEVDLGSDVEPDPVVLVLEPAPGLAISGRVEDPHGAPLPGARVLTGDAVAAAGGSFNPGAVTGSDGGFVMGGFAPGGAVALFVTLDGMAVQAPGGVVPATPGDSEIRVVMVQEARITGTVYAPDGSPLPGARVEARPEPAGPGTRTFWYGTDSEGSFAIRALAGGSYVVECTAAGFLPTTPRPVSVATGESASLDFHLEAGREVRGRVVESTTGQGVEGARIGWGPEPRGSGRGGSTVSAPDGTFQMVGLEDRAYSLEVLPPAGYLVPSGRHLIVVTVRPGDTPTLELARGITVRGRAVTESGDGVPSLRYRSLCAGAEFRTGRAESPGGQFELGGLPACIDELALSADGLVTAVVPVTGGTSERFTIDLGTIVMRGGATVRGVVVDPDGAPVESAGVSARPVEVPPGTDAARLGRATRTDATGAFELTGLAAGRYELVAGARGFRPSEPMIVALGGSAETAGVELRLGSGATVSGRVTARDGTPQAGLRVSAVLEVQPGRWRMGGSHAVTGEDGAYEITGLVAGTYGIRLEPPAPLVRTTDTIDREIEKRLVVPEGDGVLLQCDFRGEDLCELTGEITGWDTAEEARLGVGTRITLFGEPGRAGATVGEDGRFAAGEVLPGTYRLRLQGAPDIEVEVPASAAHHLVVSLPTARLSGIVRTAGGTPATEGRVIVEPRDGATSRHSLRLDVAGRFTLAHGEPGTYRLEWRVDDEIRATLEGVELSAGGVLEGLVLQEE